MPVRDAYVAFEPVDPNALAGGGSAATPSGHTLRFRDLLDSADTGPEGTIVTADQDTIIVLAGLPTLFRVVELPDDFQPDLSDVTEEPLTGDLERRYKLDELQQLAQDRGLTSDGTKAEIAERLRAVGAAAQGDPVVGIDSVLAQEGTPGALRQDGTVTPETPSESAQHATPAARTGQPNRPRGADTRQGTVVSEARQTAGTADTDDRTEG